VRRGVGTLACRADTRVGAWRTLEILGRLRPLYGSELSHGSLPASACPPAGNLPSGQAFAWVDRGLDATRCGPVYLRQEAVARLVVNSIRRGVELGHYLLHAFVVMPNHVHVLLTPRVPPSRRERGARLSVVERRGEAVAGLREESRSGKQDCSRHQR
jgi:hypothetical protein